MPSSADVWGVVVAGGSGRRFGGSEPKQFVSLAGHPMLVWPVSAFQQHAEVAGVVLVVPEAYAEDPPAWLRKLAGSGVRLAAGGPARSDSVRLGVERVPEDAEFIAVHDAARPLLTAGILSRLFAVRDASSGVIAARRMTDTVKEVSESGRVVRTVDRGTLWRAETPQLFPRSVLADVYRSAVADGARASDCAGLCERYGVPVRVVEITEPNVKVTTEADLKLCGALLGARERATPA